MLRWTLKSLLSEPAALAAGIAAAGSALLLVMFYEIPRPAHWSAKTTSRPRHVRC